MTGAGLPSLRQKRIIIEKMASWMLTIASALIGILLVELFCWLFVPSLGWNMPGRDRRVIFFDGPSPIFENHGDIFTYLPHSKIRNLTAFLTDHGFVTEYDYRFETNNFGLVQDADIAPQRDSLLLLGDFFTEGQGAEPWFRLVSPTIEKLEYQPINGGVMGTGFEQWLRLGRYLAGKNIEARKLLVIFISNDYTRSVWNVPQPVFACLSDPPLCEVEKSYLYRLPPPEELPSWIAKVRTVRGPIKPRLKLSAAALMPASYSVYIYLTQLARFSRAERESHDAIAELIRLYGRKNVAFLHLPQKDEVGRGPEIIGLRARLAIEEAGGKLFDGFKLCNMTESDYYTDDDHPNKIGYAKIAVCATNVINELVGEN